MNLTGMMVETCIYVLNERRPTGVGRVVTDDGGGVCQVDIGSPHGCAPWIVYESKAHLRPYWKRRS